MPTSGGARAATLAIASDDGDENPYDFAIQGTGITPPVVSTEAVSGITSSSAVGNGTISDLGFANPTAHGVCWNTTGTPTLAGSFSDEGAATATGAFTSAMTGLSAYVIYHVRAYATNSAGTAYGGEVTFTTSPVAPAVTTQAVTAITATGATGHGTIVTLGVPNPTAHGVCWNTAGTPTTADGVTDLGAAGATGAFTAAMNGLSAYTTYHVRAYATNAAGTAYGGEVTFTTSPVAPAVTTQAVTAITATGATGNGTITDLGVPNPTAHGVCWNTAGTPTTADGVTDLGAAGATGAFTAAMNGLSAYTTYHVRAYATNAAGTAYGGEVTFTTSAVAPAVTTQAVSAITATGATGHGTIVTLGVPNPTAHGVCWNTAGSPTIADSFTDAGAAGAHGSILDHHGRTERLHHLPCPRLRHQRRRHRLRRRSHLHHQRRRARSDHPGRHAPSPPQERPATAPSPTWERLPPPLTASAGTPPARPPSPTASLTREPPRRRAHSPPP